MTAIAAAIFFISAAVIGLELVLVRALSIGHWHHFSYLVISTALLGFGTGGTFVAVGLRFLKARYRTAIWCFAVGFGLVVPLVFYVSQKVPFDELQLIWDRRQLFYLFAYYLLFFVPFFFAAGGISLAFTVFSDKAHRLYFSNMAGSGFGAAATVALMYGNSPERLLMAVSCTGFAAALIVAVSISWRRVAVTLVCAAVWLAAFGPARAFELQIDISEHKALVWCRALPGAKVSAASYSPLARLDCVQAQGIRHFPGLSFAYNGALPAQMVIISDGDGISAVNHFEDMNDLRCYDYTTSALPYHLLSEPRVCVIGAGGGSDVAQALALNAHSITAVEMNPQVIAFVREFDRFASGLYRRDEVQVVIAEGRNFLQTTAQSFDIITISLLDSLSASAAGLYTLNESHLYTVEAVEQTLKKLRPGGLLSITRVLKTPPRDSLKMLATVAEALRKRRVENPAQNIIMIRGLATATIVASVEPFTAAHLEKARRFARDRSFDLVHLPDIDPNEANQFHVLQEGPVYYESAQRILSSRYEIFYRDYAYNIRPAADDRPYFFDFFRWKAVPYMIRQTGRDWLRFSEWGYLLLVATLLQAVCAGAFLILLPLWAARPIRSIRAGKFAVLLYFLLVGLAYMFLEMAFIQKMTLLIGHPVFGVAVTLTGFLFFSGLGSLVSGRILHKARGFSSSRLIWTAVITIVGVGSAEIILMSVWFEWLVGLPDVFRWLFGLAITGLPAFFMGIPFPTGLSQLHTNSQPLVPWAWGVNGFASVIGAVLGTLLAISVGFTVLAVVSLGCYFLAAAASKQIFGQDAGRG